MNSPIHSILDIDERFARLEAQVADLTEGSKETARMNTRLEGLETDVHRFTGALEGFLGRIRIDDGLRLVRDDRRIGSVDPANFPLDAADDNVIHMESTSEPDPLGSDPMVISDDDEAPSDLPTLMAGTASTPSDTTGDIRMDMPVSRVQPPSEPGISPPPPPAAAPGAGPPPQTAGSESPAPPPLLPPPTLNLIPATPQTSQEKADQSVGPQPDPNPTRPAESEPSRPRVVSREMTRAGLRPPVTRSRSRSKTPL